MSEAGQRADLGDKLKKVTVSCYNKCGRTINILVHGGIKRLPRKICAACKNRASEIGHFWS